MTLHDDVYLCGRCVVIADWEGVVLSAQGVAVRQVVAAVPPAPAAPVPSNGSALPPADPFSN